MPTPPEEYAGYRDERLACPISRWGGDLAEGKTIVKKDRDSGFGIISVFVETQKIKK